MKVLIVGGVAGGASAAARLRRLDEQAEIILFERGNYISFANCGLPYYIGQTIRERGDLLVQTPERMRERFRVDVRVNSEVVRIDRENRLVEVKGPEGIYVEHYDKLLLSTGASPSKPPISGIELENVFTVWSIPDADRVYAYLQKKSVQRAVVVGGGFVGIEMVENLVERGVCVTLVEMLKQAMSSVDYEIAQWLHMELARNKVKMMFSRAISRIQADENGTIVYLADGTQVETDMVIMSAGVRPNSQLAQQAGLATGTKGHILVDEYLRTSDPDIYAVGDVVEVPHYVTKKKIAAALAGPANKQGRIAADNLFGSQVQYPGAQMTSVAKVFGKTVASTGLSEQRLIAEGARCHADYEVIVAHPNNFAGYYPGNAPIHMKVLYDPNTGKLLGAQACGEAGTEKRIDVISACMYFGGTVYDLARLDLAYAPPYNTAKDPVNFIGYIAENVKNGLVDLVSWLEVMEMKNSDCCVVDVRTREEFEAGTYPGAVSLPLDQLRDSLTSVPKDKTLLLFCRSGVRSYLAARILSQHGFPTKSIGGGWLSYEALTYQIP